MIRRRSFLAMTAALSALSVASQIKAEVKIGDDGLHKQDFFLDSFLEMGPDLEEAAAEGKGLIILFEQRGCPYCRELHEVNFERPEIVDFLTGSFEIVQLNLWGDREVVDFDGETLSEKKLAAKWYVNFTPTMIIIPAEAAGVQSVREAAAFTMPGYFKPFHFVSSLEYVASGAFKDLGFQRFLQAKGQRLAAEGIEVDLW
ncbi:MAG: thioredoxin family protein [Paracoccaceae bacterium]